MKDGPNKSGAGISMPGRILPYRTSTAPPETGTLQLCVGHDLDGILGVVAQSTFLRL